MFILQSKQLYSFEIFSASLHSLVPYPRPIIYFKNLIRLAYSMY